MMPFCGFNRYQSSCVRPVAIYLRLTSRAFVLKIHWNAVLGCNACFLAFDLDWRMVQNGRTNIRFFQADRHADVDEKGVLPTAFCIGVGKRDVFDSYPICSWHLPFRWN